MRIFKILGHFFSCRLIPIGNHNFTSFHNHLLGASTHNLLNGCRSAGKKSFDHSRKQQDRRNRLQPDNDPEKDNEEFHQRRYSPPQVTEQKSSGAQQSYCHSDPLKSTFFIHQSVSSVWLWLFIEQPLYQTRSHRHLTKFTLVSISYGIFTAKGRVVSNPDL